MSYSKHKITLTDTETLLVIKGLNMRKESLFCPVEDSLMAAVLINRIKEQVSKDKSVRHREPERRTCRICKWYIRTDEYTGECNCPFRKCRKPKNCTQKACDKFEENVFPECIEVKK